MGFDANEGDKTGRSCLKEHRKEMGIFLRIELNIMKKVKRPSESRTF